MKITYIKQSSFLLEWENSLWLFDYFAGELPDLDPRKRLITFTSHGHKDHFSYELFSRTSGHPHTLHLLSDDISISARDRASYEISRQQGNAMKFLAPHLSYCFDDGAGNEIAVRTLLSTDQGLAFLIDYCGRRIYHAGDLHWWIWDGEPPQEAQAMERRFFAEIDALKNVRIDAAFLTLDPRLEGNFAKGFDAVMRTAHIDAVFPMHFWEDPCVNQRLLAMECSQPYRQKIRPVVCEGESFVF